MKKEYIAIPLYDTDNGKKDIVEITINGKDVISSESKILLEMSKEALIGFATHALRISTNVDDNDEHHWHVDPLNSPSGNQPIGFFLTDDSPMVVLSYKQNQNSRKVKIEDFKKLKMRTDYNFKHLISLREFDTELETFQIGFSNICKLSVYNKDSVDITDKCISVVISINKNGLSQFAEYLIKLAHVYRESVEYTIYKEMSNKKSYNFGIVLSKNSSDLTIKCSHLGTVFEYEPAFGNKKN